VTVAGEPPHAIAARARMNTRCEKAFIAPPLC
jgi:hypothetical protein